VVKEKWPFHQKWNKCYRIKVQNNGKMEIDSERRVEGRKYNFPGPGEK